MYFTYAMMWDHSVKCTCENWWWHNENVTSFPTTHCYGQTLSCLYLWSVVETTLEISFYRLRALCFHCMLGTNRRRGIFFFLRFLCPKKPMKRLKKKFHDVKKFSCFLGEAFFCSGTCMKRAMCVLIIWESFSIQLFLHRQENFLSRDALSRFHCKLNSWPGNSSQY